MKFDVSLLSFLDGQIREVEVPDEDLREMPTSIVLKQVFHWGQNDFQPQQLPSVSVGDVIHLEIDMVGGNMQDSNWLVVSLGFKELTDEELEEYKNRDNRAVYALTL